MQRTLTTFATIILSLSLILNVCVPASAQEMPLKTDEVRYSTNAFRQEAMGGLLDTTFNGTGKVRTGFGFGEDRAQAAALQSDGKLVIVGCSLVEGWRGVFVVTRYNIDGRLDTTFDGDGKVVTEVSPYNDCATAVAIQPDNKMVVAGYISNGSSVGNIAVVRYKADGSIDTTFGENGKATKKIGVWSSSASSIILQPDGKIIVAGVASNNSPSYFAVVRYLSDGSLDTTFGNDGIITTSIFTHSKANAVAIQFDGKIVAAGYTYNGQASSDFAVVRYNTDGSLDTSFDSDGKLTTSVYKNNSVNALAIQTDGKIIAAGITLKGLSHDFALVRYNMDGSLDRAFGRSGKVTTTFNTGSNYCSSVVVQQDGNIIAAGAAAVVDAASNIARNSFALARYNTNGSLDVTFGEDGKVTTSINGNSLSQVKTVLNQPDGKLVAAGQSYLWDNDFAITRYNTDGSLDSSFNSTGKNTSDIVNGLSKGFSVLVQADGKMLVAGTSSAFGFTLTRYNTDGSLDTTFDDDGKIITRIGKTGSGAYSIATQADGKIVAAGQSAYKFALARYNTDGRVDESFGTEGEVIASDGEAFGVAIQLDGKIIAVGRNLPNIGYMIVTRYNADGSLDTSFGNNGVALLDGEAFSVAVQSDGKILIAGTLYYSSPRGFSVVRYNTDGSLDTSFDGDGIVTTNIGQLRDTANSIAVQSDGKIVVAGNSEREAGNSDFALIRYNTDGSLDTSFDGDGIVTTQIGEGFSEARSVVIQPDNKILAAGSGKGDFTLVRYNPDGSLDKSFSNYGAAKRGVVLIDFGGYDIAYSVKLDATGRIVVAGTGKGIFAVARLQNNIAAFQTKN